MMTNVSTPGRTFILWLKGMLVGAATGMLALMGPTLGFALVILGLVLSLRDRPRLWSSGGILIGAGFTWLFLIWRATASCQTIQTPNYYSDCRPPDVSPYIGAAVMFVVVGSVLLIAASFWQRRTQRRHTNGDNKTTTS